MPFQIYESLASGGGATAVAGPWGDCSYADLVKRVDADDLSEADF